MSVGQKELPSSRHRAIEARVRQVRHEQLVELHARAVVVLLHVLAQQPPGSGLEGAADVKAGRADERPPATRPRLSATFGGGAVLQLRSPDGFAGVWVDVAGLD